MLLGDVNLCVSFDANSAAIPNTATTDFNRMRSSGISVKIEVHRHFIGAGLRIRFADFIRVGGRATISLCSV